MSNEQQKEYDSVPSPLDQQPTLQPIPEQQTTHTIERLLHRRSFPICPKCNTSCTKDDGDLLRAFNQVYHYQCFTCEDCQIPVADKYFPLITTDNKRQKRRVYCEYHHLKRIGMICPKCDKVLTSNDQKYHLECIQCPLCTVTQPSQYEYNGTSYCRIHYSLIPETHCSGCDQAILKQFVEHVDLPNQIWHPECYMIYKFWSIKLNIMPPTQDTTKVIDIQIQVEKKVTRVWTDLSSFEESSANCISDMLLNVAAGAYIEGIRMANQFITHLHVLFSALDILEQHLSAHNEELNCKKEANLLCKKMTRFFEILTIPSSSSLSASAKEVVNQNITGEGITQELLPLVTGLAQNLKSLIRIGLAAALHLEREIGIENAIPEFLNQLLELEKKRGWIAGRYWFKDPPAISPAKEEEFNNCYKCHLIIQNTDCYAYKETKWHPECFICNTCSTKLNETSSLLNTSNFILYCQSCCTTATATTNNVLQPCTHVTLLQLYLFNLKFYLAKLFSTSSSASSTSSTSNIGRTAPNKSINSEIIMPETKRRQRSILRMLGTSRQKRSDSVHLGQIERTNTTTPFDEKNLMISTEQSSTPTEITSPVMVTPTSPRNKITNNIRRTFSTNSTNRRMSLHGIFGGNNNKRGAAEARRASLLTLDETGLTRGKTVYLSTLTPVRDFIARHVAVITIQPLIIPPYSFDELIHFIETNKKIKKTAKRKSTTTTPASALWGKLITHIKITNGIVAKGTASNVEENKIFGASLSTLAIREKQESKKQEQQKGVTLRDFTPAIAASFSDNALIPIFIQTCVMAILQSDMSIEGVFRKNGNIRQLKELAESIDTASATATDTLESLLFTQNSIQLAALLKKYLRELPEPLMTFSLYKLFVRCGHQQHIEKRKRILHLACCLLPKPNRDTMLLIFCCLKWVATFSDTNKMDIPNLARVIAPNVLYDKPSNSSTATADLVRQGAQEEINVIETLIREADQIAIVPSDLLLMSLQENVNQDMADLNSRYFINHYIQLLNQKRRLSKSAAAGENDNPNTTSTATAPESLRIKSADTTTKSPINIIPTPSTPIPSANTKQRRSSWIPGLIRR